MMVKVTVLIDDTVHMPWIRTEHGLSLLIETEGGCVLFDAGASALARENAERLGANLAGAGAVVLSHGHYDHTGGLPDILAATGPIDVFAHPDTFRTRYAKVPGRGLRKAGSPWKRREAEKLGARFRLGTGPAEILRGIYATGEIPRKAAFERPDGRLVVKGKAGITQDPLRDDQALVVARGRTLFVFLGCCHAGLINTLSHVAALFPGKRIGGVAGGLHLLNAGEKRIGKTIDYLRGLDTGLVAACHCTGFKASARLSQAFGKKFVPLTTGDVLTFK